jgi:hypothetical protein
MSDAKIKPPSPVKRKWKNHASAEIGRKYGGRPEKENLLEGLTNLETGEAHSGTTNPYFPSMKAAALALKLDIQILKNARLHDCPAFRSSGNVHREQLIRWLKDNPSGGGIEPASEQEDEFVDNYDVPDEVGGVGQTLKSLQAYERRAKKKLDDAEKSSLHPALKAEAVKAAQDAWIKVVNALLKYDLSVSQAKRESGELIPISEAQAGVHALMAWHAIATSDALRNVIPTLEGKSKFEIAAMLDRELRSSIYRNFKTGREIGKIPEWMEKTALASIEKQPALSAKPKVDLSSF